MIYYDPLNFHNSITHYIRDTIAAHVRFVLTSVMEHGGTNYFLIKILALLNLIYIYYIAINDEQLGE